jgi:hypothetical protein
MRADHSYVRGAFAVFAPGSYPNGSLIPFRFNPEALNRTLQIEQAQGNQATEGAQRRDRGSGSTEQAADAASGTLKETFTIQIRFDLRDREEGQAAVDPDTLKFGILPEISALEELMHPAPAPAQAAETGREAVAARQQRPTVLLVWGTHRVFPVRVVSMTINETLHNEELAPVRAEIEVGLEIAREADARDNQAIGDGLRYMRDQRSQYARRFYERVSVQGSSVSGLGQLANTQLRQP